MKTLRASEIGAFLYCERAWWYQKKGIESTNVAEMKTGSEIHYQHGRKVMAAGLMRTVAVLLLLAGLVVLAAYFTGRLL